MKTVLKISTLIVMSGCTINFITHSPPTENAPTESPQPQAQPTVQATELPPNLRPENTGANVNTAPTPPAGQTTPATTIPTLADSSNINNTPAAPISTPEPEPEAAATPLPTGIASPVPDAPSLTQNDSLEAPKGLLTVGVEETSVTISWKASTNADYYRVYQNDILIGDNLTQLQFTATGLNPGKSYQFQVSAVNAQKQESPKSRTLSVGFF